MITTPNCFKRNCKYYQGVEQPDGTELTERCVCAAYPDGIPDTIVLGQDLHNTIRSDQDNEIVYERRSE